MYARVCSLFVVALICWEGEGRTYDDIISSLKSAISEKFGKRKDVATYSRTNACFGVGLKVVTEPNKQTLSLDNCNATFQTTEWEREPKVYYTDTLTEELYMLALLDPVSSVRREYNLMWLVANIEGSEFAEGDLSEADVLLPYHPLIVTEDSYRHRYQLIVFQQEAPYPLPFSPLLESERLNIPFFGYIRSLSEMTRFIGPQSGVQFYVTRTPDAQKGN
uniref:Phosphatidylethanolamine-binding protein n=1 Tax=Clastoptera arizonana TaxID=38151 RepID=A0A1B6CHS9_9HEMI